MTNRFQSALKPVTLAVAAFILAGCSSLNPNPLEDQAVRDRASSDRVKMFDQQEPIAAPISMEEAIARSLKYNLDRRSKMMEEALALGQLDVGKFDMLPKLMAQAGYGYRDKPRFAGSTRYDDWVASGIPSSFTPSQTSTTTEPTHYTAELGMTWSLLDFGIGYYGTKQNEARFQIASEKRRKAIGLTPDEPLLLSMTGDARRGEALLSPTGMMAACLACHFVKGTGRDFGPDLSKVGSRLTKEQLLESLLHPSKQIAQGYAAYTAELTDGTLQMGFAVKQTKDETVLKLATGQSITLRAADLKSLKPLPTSLMPEGLLSSSCSSFCGTGLFVAVPGPQSAFTSTTCA